MSKYIMRDCCATFAALAAEDDANASVNFKINNPMVDNLEDSTIDETEFRIVALCYSNYKRVLVKTNAPEKVMQEAMKYLDNIRNSSDYMTEDRVFATLSEYIKGKGYIWEDTSISQIIKGA